MSSSQEKFYSSKRISIIKEAQKIEESSVYSAKGHYNTSVESKRVHYLLGIPLIIFSSILNFEFKGDFPFAFLIPWVVTILSALMTFLNSKEQADLHFRSGNKYMSLADKVRIFWSIDCFGDEHDDALCNQLKQFNEDKDGIRKSSPSISFTAYLWAKIGIKIGGEASFTVDKVKKKTNKDKPVNTPSIE